MKRSVHGHRVGEWHPRAKLTAEQVASIRAEYVPYVTGMGALARKYGCGRSTIRDIVTLSTRVAG